MSAKHDRKLTVVVVAADPVEVEAEDLVVAVEEDLTGAAPAVEGIKILGDKS